MSEEDSTLDLLPDERIIYKGKGGRFSFFKFFPASSIIATNKRFFILTPMSKKRSFFYDKISSIRISRGLLNSRFIISSADGEREGLKTNLTFYNKGHAMVFFSVISNQIQAIKDPYHVHKQKAYALDSTYNVLSDNSVYTQPTTDMMLNISKHARIEKSTAKKVQKTLIVEKEARAPQIYDAKPKQEIIPSTTELGVGMSSFTQKLQSPFKTIKPESTVGYFAAGKELTPKTTVVGQSGESALVVKVGKVQQKQSQHRVKITPEFDPDADLKIFSIRRMKGIDIKGKSNGKKRANPFNIPSAK